MKYIFVTGGVVSSLGKGLAAASLGTLLEARGHKVLLQKFDPYLNVDPGTMSPYQHGEVYVLEDGAETDLDLGHYERFTSSRLTRLNTLTSGQVYLNVIEKERRGDYLGKTVQVIPHVTDEIKNRLREVSSQTDADVIITEIGGTVGDIEGLPFLEAIRQYGLEVGEDNACFIHVTLIPYIKAAGELKTKPTQQSVAKLREIGIAPNLLMCRSEYDVEPDVRAKIALFCNIRRRAVIEFRDVSHSIYECPLMMHSQGLDDLVSEHLGLDDVEPDLTAWRSFVHHVIHPSKRCRIAVVGKYIELIDAYKSIYESLTHAGAANDCLVKIVRVDSEQIESDGAEAHLSDVHGVLIPGGFGDRGTEGKIMAAQYARENDKAYLGICLGMQLACIEFARHVCDIEGANSTEFDAATKEPIISLLEEQEQVTDLGGTMRLGSWDCQLKAGTRAAELYGKAQVRERHRHRYEFNQKYRKPLEEAGLVFSGTSPDESLAEIVEIADHPFYVACQFHPEFQSKPNDAHPLFKGLVSAALEVREAMR